METRLLLLCWRLRNVSHSAAGWCSVQILKEIRSQRQAVCIFPHSPIQFFPLCGRVAAPQKRKTKLRVSVSGFPASFHSSLEPGLVTSSRRPLFCSQLEPESGPRRKREKKGSAGINFCSPLALIRLAAERRLQPQLQPQPRLWIWIWSLLECYWKAGQKDLARGISTGPEPASICNWARRRWGISIQTRQRWKKQEKKKHI